MTVRYRCDKSCRDPCFTPDLMPSPQSACHTLSLVSDFRHRLNLAAFMSLTPARPAPASLPPAPARSPVGPSQWKSLVLDELLAVEFDEFLAHVADKVCCESPVLPVAASTAPHQLRAASID